MQFQQGASLAPAQLHAPPPVAPPQPQGGGAPHQYAGVQHQPLQAPPAPAAGNVAPPPQPQGGAAPYVQQQQPPPVHPQHPQAFASAPQPPPLQNGGASYQHKQQQQQQQQQQQPQQQQPQQPSPPQPPPAPATDDAPQPQGGAAPYVQQQQQPSPVHPQHPQAFASAPQPPPLQNGGASYQHKQQQQQQQPAPGPHPLAPAPGVSPPPQPQNGAAVQAQPLVSQPSPAQPPYTQPMGDVSYGHAGVLQPQPAAVGAGGAAYPHPHPHASAALTSSHLHAGANGMGAPPPHVYAPPVGAVGANGVGAPASVSPPPYAAAPHSYIQGLEYSVHQPQAPKLPAPADPFAHRDALHAKLRPYQREVFQQAAVENAIVVMPTGTGKTLVAFAVAEAVRAEAVARGETPKPTLFLCKTKALASQQSRVCQRTFEDIGTHRAVRFMNKDSEFYLDRRTIEAERYDFLFGITDFVSASLETKKASLADFALVIFDECHQVNKQSSGVKIMNIFYEHCAPKPRILGLTATPVFNQGKMAENVQQLCNNLRSRFVTVHEAANVAEMDRFAAQGEPTIHLAPPSSREMHVTAALQQRLWMIRQELLRFVDLKVGGSAETTNAQILAIGKTQEACDNSMKQLGTAAQLSFREGLAKVCAVYEVVADCMELAAAVGVRVASDTWAEARDNLQTFPLLPDAGPGREELQLAWDIVQETCANIDQLLQQHPEDAGSKELFLLQTLSDEAHKAQQEGYTMRVLVFAQTKREIARLQTRLCTLAAHNPVLQDINFAQLSSDTSETQASRTLHAFTRGACQVILCTTVLEEGIDMRDCSLVVRYFMKDLNMASLGQCRGRARRDGARFVLFVESEKQKDTAVRNLDTVSVIRRLRGLANEFTPRMQGGIGEWWQDSNYAERLLLFYCHEVQRKYNVPVPMVQRAGNGMDGEHVTLDLHANGQRQTFSGSGPTLDRARTEVFFQGCKWLDSLGLLQEYSTRTFLQDRRFGITTFDSQTAATAERASTGVRELRFISRQDWPFAVLPTTKLVQLASNKYNVQVVESGERHTQGRVSVRVEVNVGGRKRTFHDRGEDGEGYANITAATENAVIMALRSDIFKFTFTNQEAPEALRSAVPQAAAPAVPVIGRTWDHTQRQSVDTIAWVRTDAQAHNSRQHPHPHAPAATHPQPAFHSTPDAHLPQPQHHPSLPPHTPAHAGAPHQHPTQPQPQQHGYHAQPPPAQHVQQQYQDQHPTQPQQHENHAQPPPAQHVQQQYQDQHPTQPQQHENHAQPPPAQHLQHQHQQQQHPSPPPHTPAHAGAPHAPPPQQQHPTQPQPQQHGYHAQPPAQHVQHQHQQQYQQQYQDQHPTQPQQHENHGQPPPAQHVQHQYQQQYQQQHQHAIGVPQPPPVEHHHPHGDRGSSPPHQHPAPAPQPPQHHYHHEPVPQPAPHMHNGAPSAPAPHQPHATAPPPAPQAPHAALSASPHQPPAPAPQPGHYNASYAPPPHHDPTQPNMQHAHAVAPPPYQHPTQPAQQPHPHPHPRPAHPQQPAYGAAAGGPPQHQHPPPVQAPQYQPHAYPPAPAPAELGSRAGQLYHTPPAGQHAAAPSAAAATGPPPQYAQAYPPPPWAQAYPPPHATAPPH